MKQTAVEWFYTKLITGKFTGNDTIEFLYETAKEMEKEQIIKAVYHNCNAMSHSDLDCGEEYYSNQFKSE
jgi:hypothetical protein